MPLFGFQLCLTIVMAFFLQKLMPIYSLGRWLLCNGSLVRYKHPTDEDLKKLSGKANEKLANKSRNRKGNNRNKLDSKVFKLSKRIDIPLEVQPVSTIDTLILRNYTEYQMLVDFTVIGLLVYIGTEIYYELWNPARELNVSIIWLFVSMLFATKNMVSILWLYAKSKAGGEISMSIAFGMFCFVISLATLMVKENILEFGLDYYIEQHNNVNGNSSDTKRSFSLPGIKLLLAGFSAVIGVLFTFPAIRLAQMYVDSLKYSKENQFMQLMLHINFFAPAFIVLMWIKPLTRDFIKNPNLLALNESLPLLTDCQFDMLRIVLVIGACILRLILMRTHLQAYLNIAYDKMRKIRKESGLITNTDLQKTVTQVYYYLGIVATQYLSPLVLLFCSVLCLKTLGGYSWNGLLSSYVENFKNESEIAASSSILNENATLQEMIKELGSNFYDFRAIFTPLLLRGIFSYFVWSSATNWFMATCMGYFYHFYLST